MPWGSTHLLLKDQKTQHWGNPGPRIPEGRHSRPTGGAQVSIRLSPPPGKEWERSQPARGLSQRAAQPSAPLQGPGSPDAVAPAPLHPAAPQGPVLGGRHRRGRLPLLPGGRAAAGAQRRLHNGFIHRAGGQPGGAEPTPAPLPERVRREDPAGGAQAR